MRKNPEYKLHTPPLLEKGRRKKKHKKKFRLPKLAVSLYFQASFYNIERGESKKLPLYIPHQRKWSGRLCKSAGGCGRAEGVSHVTSAFPPFFEKFFLFSVHAIDGKKHTHTKREFFTYFFDTRRRREKNDVEKMRVPLFSHVPSDLPSNLSLRKDRHFVNKMFSPIFFCSWRVSPDVTVVDDTVIKIVRIPVIDSKPDRRPFLEMLARKVGNYFVDQIEKKTLINFMGMTWTALKSQVTVQTVEWKAAFTFWTVSDSTAAFNAFLFALERFDSSRWNRSNYTSPLNSRKVEGKTFYFDWLLTHEL